MDVGAEPVEHGRLGVDPEFESAAVDGRQAGVGGRAGQHHRAGPVFVKAAEPARLAVIVPAAP